MDILDKDIFYICDVEKEGTSFFHGDLYELRKRLYENKGRKVSVRKKITETGADGKLTASVSKSRLKWKKRIGRVVTEQSYRQSNGSVLVRKDLNGSIICKIFYDEEMAWYRTEYYSPESFIQPKLVLRSADLGDIIERLSFNEENKYYEREDLTPTPLNKEDFENYYDIENGVLVAASDGEFVYKPDYDVYDEDETNGSTVLIMNAWEVKSGSVPTSAKSKEQALTFKNLDEIGDKAPVKDVAKEAPKKEAPAKKTVDSDSEATKTAKAGENKAVEKAVSSEKVGEEKPKENSEAKKPTTPEKIEVKADAKTEAKTEETSSEQKKEVVSENKTAEISEKEKITENNDNEKNESSDNNKEVKNSAKPTKEEADETDKEAKSESLTVKSSNAQKQKIGKYHYSGMMVDGKREGIGHTENENGVSVYNGEYHDDKRNGVGASFFSDGKLSFAGNWADDKKNGVGISFRPSDGSVHIANWENGKPSENITLIDGKGNLLYSGIMQDGKKNGVGVSRNNETGYTYIGEFADGKSNGIGSLFDENGRLIYNGSWANGMKNGHGTEFDAAGNIVYSGEWVDNEYHNGILYQKI